MYIASAKHNTARPAADEIRNSRRPPFMRSSAGPRTGAMITNGVIVMRRKSKTFPRAALVGLEKKIEPAIDTRMQASPHAPAAWAYTSRAKGVGSANRGSVLMSLPDDTPHVRDVRPRPGAGSGEYHCQVTGLETASAQPAPPHPPFSDASERFLNR